MAPNKEITENRLMFKQFCILKCPCYAKFCNFIIDNYFILSDEFFNYPQEILFRSFSEILKLVGKKYFFVRGKKIERILKSLNKKTDVKYTLGNCIIEKINKTVIVLKEHNN